MIKTIPILILALLITGCTAEQNEIIEQLIDAANTPGDVHYVHPSLNDSQITIASWNIQVFGKSKAAKPEVMEIIAKTIARYDIVAIQEIRDKSGTAIKDLEAAVDALGTDYDYIIGPRLGRTSSKEQYAYIYRTDRIKVHAVHAPGDSQDIFHREPFIAWFTTLPEGNDSFDFVLLNIHTDPDEATEEINALPDVLKNAQRLFSNEDDFIILGDYNSDCNYHNELDKRALPLDRFIWAIPDSADTNLAKSSCTYDRIVMTRQTTEPDWTGDAGVFRFDREFNLNPTDAKAVSDHYPVWASFHTDREEVIS